ncbi:MAG: hypothetical protein ACE5JL_17650, partial [Dehalococcoidia bacterium]
GLAHIDRALDFADAIATVVQNVALPYGYTLSVWSAGAIAIFAYGTPRKRDALLFVAGAVIGFLVFDIPTWWSVSADTTLTVRLPSIALLNVFPLVAVGASGLLIRRVVRRDIGYFVSGLTATVVYIVSLALLFALLG